MVSEQIDHYPITTALKRIGAAIFSLAAALAAMLAIYYLLHEIDDKGVINFSFLVITPICVSAFIAYVADPLFKKPLKAYLLTPLIFIVLVTLLSAFVLKEGVICIIMLLPLWLPLSFMGSFITYRIRNAVKLSRAQCSTLLLLPFIAIPIENNMIIDPRTENVSREIIINAAPEQIWPLLRGIENVAPYEGQWNITQDIIDVPRPIGAKLVGDGIGAQRYAKWDKNVSFREEITQWRKHERIGWKFIFDDTDKWEFDDKHLMPDSQYFRVISGGYSLEKLSNGQTKVSLDTQYWMQVPLSGYAALWGEYMLGDIHNNLLNMIKNRAETNPNTTKAAIQ